MSKVEDLRPVKFPELSWKTADFEICLEDLYIYVIDQTERARQWYFLKRRSKRIGGFALRGGAIIFTALAGIIPILGQIFEKDDVPQINPVWATVAIGIAALFVVLDRLGGFTSGWIRYVLSGQELGHLMETFRFNWEKSKLCQTDQALTTEQAQELLSQCKTFLLEINTVVREETELWAAEFQSALKEVEKAAKVTAKLKEFGAIDVQVTNGDECENGWTLKVGESPERSYKGKRASVTNIIPKIYAVRVLGEIAGKAVMAERAVAVTSGQISEVKLTLS